MTAIATIRAAIVAKLQEAPSVGRVHATRVDARTPQEIRDRFYDGDALRAWIVSQASLSEVSETVGTAELTFGWDIEGFVGFGDGGDGEAALDGLIDQIRPRFRNTDLGIDGLTTVTPNQAGVAVIDRQPVMLGRQGGVLCAYAKLRLITCVDE